MIYICPHRAGPGERKAKKVALEERNAETAPGIREARLTRAAGQGRKGDQITRQCDTSCAVGMAAREEWVQGHQS